MGPYTPQNEPYSKDRFKGLIGYDSQPYKKFCLSGLMGYNHPNLRGLLEPIAERLESGMDVLMVVLPLAEVLMGCNRKPANETCNCTSQPPTMLSPLVG